MPTTAAKHRDETIDPFDKPVDEVLHDTEILTLTARDWEAFLAVWDDIDRPRPRLEAAIRRYLSDRQRDAG